MNILIERCNEIVALIATVRSQIAVPLVVDRATALLRVIMALMERDG